MATGTNDVGILMAIIFFCLACAFVAPLVTNAVETNTKYYTSNFSVADPYSSTSAYTAPTTEPFVVGTGIFAILRVVGQAIFWVFDWAPWWFNLIHIVVRLAGVVLLWRLARSGGG